MPTIADDSARAKRSEVAEARWRRAAAAAEKEEFKPGHVRNCANNPKAEGRWTLAYWPKASPTAQTRVAYTCGSYRCPSVECQRAAAHRDFAKLRDAVESVRGDGSGWCFLVLTIDQKETLRRRASSDAGWKNEQEAFKALSKMSRSFLARLRRWHKAEGWGSFGNRWVATVEVQRNGWPHLNLVIHSPGLAAWLDAQGPVVAGDEKKSWPLRGQLLDHATASDWGSVGYAERAKSRDGLMGYITKLAGNFDRQVGEIAKLTQAPTNARMKLRRLRAGKGFIQVKQRSGNYTGIMLRERREWGKVVVAPLMQPDQVKCPAEEQPNYLEGVRTAIRERQREVNAGDHPPRVEPVAEIWRASSLWTVPKLTDYLGQIDPPARDPGRSWPIKTAAARGGLVLLKDPWPI